MLNWRLLYFESAVFFFWLLELQLDADLLADFISPVFEVVKTVGGHGLVVGFGFVVRQENF